MAAIEVNTNEENYALLEDEQKLVDREPFRRFKIDETDILDTIEGRDVCRKCSKSRKYFCYTCYSPVIDRSFFPRVKLPIKIDIIKHCREIDGKSTAVHAAILAPEDVTIYTYPDFPEFSSSEKIILIFPSKVAKRVDELFTNEVEIEGEKITRRITGEIPVTRAVFIDSTWNQTKAIFKDQRLRDLPKVVLRSRISQFWRHQKKSPRWYLATIEALHQFLVELHTCAYGMAEDYANNDNGSKVIEGEDSASSDESTKPYNGQYDNLLYFFKYMFEKIHVMYDHDKLHAYKRPLY